ncbi:hypothetical protein PIB30_104905 [Stylosanthes scabra]|uniref:Uncharacterized protein n=1 Tax=Stylosanthes scabra TaxID=79078 RepID=A0ABU6QXV2_9FABA|nr:hypothetical protein [Stylosanthes scabra]
MSTWSDVIKELKVYNMKHFVVVDKIARVRTTQVRWSLVFCNRTTMEQVDLLAFSLEAFRFRTIPELFAFYSDLVAEVVGKEDPMELVTSKGKETKRMTLKLHDLEDSEECG